MPLPPSVRLSSPFGWRINPVTHERKHHDGIDLAAPAGTPVRAVEGGKVWRQDWAGVDRGVINGNALHIQTPSGRIWSYLHFQSMPRREQGSPVRAGELVGSVGKTGRSTGPHLHLAVRVNGQFVDPVPLFPAGTFSR